MRTYIGEGIGKIKPLRVTVGPLMTLLFFLKE
jgi:hypothetical protein